VHSRYSDLLNLDEVARLLERKESVDIDGPSPRSSIENLNRMILDDDLEELESTVIAFSIIEDIIADLPSQ